MTARSQSRKVRGSKAQTWLADWYRPHGWAYVEPTGGGRQGADMTGMPGLAPEVKAGEEMRLESWLRQAEKRRGLAYVVWMPPGYGRARLVWWPVIMRHAAVDKLVAEAGQAWDASHTTADTFDLRGWMDAADLGHAVAYRCRGMKAAELCRWPVLMHLAWHTDLLRAAGYGGMGRGDD